MQKNAEEAYHETVSNYQNTNLSATGNFAQLALVGGCDENIEDDCVLQQETANEINSVGPRKCSHDESFVVKSDFSAYGTKSHASKKIDHRQTTKSQDSD